MNILMSTALALTGTTLAAFAVFGPFRAKPGPAATWPMLVEPTARACDARVRIDLVEALGQLRSPWSESILHAAQATETDATVKTAIATALSRV